MKQSIPPAFLYPEYRAFWIGMLASVSGFQMMQFGQIVLVHRLTESTIFLGLLGLSSGIPAIILNPLGGVYADRWDRRRLVVFTQIITALLLLLLAILTWTGLVNAWHCLVIAFLVGSVEAFDQSARRALFPHLVPRSALVSAVALNSAIWSGTRIVAPAAAGLIIAFFNPAIAFFIASLGFVVMAYFIYRLAPIPSPATTRISPAKEMLEGLNFIRRNSPFPFLIVMTFFNSFFGISYIYLMPVFAIDILKIGTIGQGWLLSISGVGSLVTTVWLGTAKEIKNKSILVIGGGISFGLSVAAFGLTSRFFPSYGMALALMLFIGLTSSTYMISIQSSLQLLVPDNMRGRVMGFFGMSWNILPIGGMQVGTLASFITAPYAVATGGLAVAAFTSLAFTFSSKVRDLNALIRN
mgnify:CR=1 FL=1